MESIPFPERFPLVSRVHESSEAYSAGESTKETDQDKIDEAVLALLQLTLHDGDRAWKGFDFEVMDRLFEKGCILDPRGKSKAVVLTREGLERSSEHFKRLFGKNQGNEEK